MKKPIFTGSCVALITPFKDGLIDFEAFRKLIDYHIENGTDAILVAGTTGEGSTLNDTEHRALLKEAGAYINGRVPFIAATGSNDTAYSIDLSRYAESVGADGLLIINPYYNKTTPQGLFAHLSAIANQVSSPVIIYNVPSRTGMNIDVDTMVELAKIPTVVGVKEASGNISQIAEIARRTDLDIYSGNDDQTLPILALGGKGVISVSANIIPKDVHDLVMTALSGDYDKAREMQLHQNILNGPLFLETNPIPINKAMEILGMGTGEIRLPLIEMSEKNTEKLTEALREYGLL